MPVMAEAAAGIDAKHVVAVGQPGAHGIQPALLAGRLLFGKLCPLVLKSSHVCSTVIPNPTEKDDESISKSLHQAWTDGTN